MPALAMQLTLACRNKENLPNFCLGTAGIMEDRFGENLGKFSSQSSGHTDRILRAENHHFHVRRFFWTRTFRWKKPSVEIEDAEIWWTTQILGKCEAEPSGPQVQQSEALILSRRASLTASFFTGIPVISLRFYRLQIMSDLSANFFINSTCIWFPIGSDAI